MRRQFLIPVLLGVGVVGVASSVGAQTLGDLGAASSISGSMSGTSSAGTMAVGSRAARDARRLGANPYMGGSNAGNAGLMEDPYGSGASPSGYGGASPGGYGGYGGGYTGGPGGTSPTGAGGPGLPNPELGDAAGGYGAAGGAAAAPKKIPLHWGKERGTDFLNELLSRPTRGRGVGRTPRGARSRASRMSAKQLARLPRPTRTRIIASKYKKPPVGYLSFYIPEDRYKLTSGLWKYVSIEDDRGRYPVKFYYRPDSPVFLRIVAQRARGTQARHNRVIGFASWQDALVAGYRPDPVSKPSPGIELANIAGMAPREQAGRYAEFLYAGQIEPTEFRRTYAYILKVRGVINSRADTRKYLRPTVGQILLAALGEGEIPRSVGGPPRAVVTAAVTPGGYGGAGGYPGASGGYGGAGGYPGSSGGSGSYSGSSGSYSGSSSPSGGSDPRSQGYDGFRGRAGSLAR